MRINDATTILRPNDWLVDIVCIGWNRKEYRFRIGVTPKGIEHEWQAERAALNSLRKRGEYPPVIKECRARRRYQVGVEGTIKQHAELTRRFVRQEA